MVATARNVDMSNVKEGGSFNQSRIAAGDYAAIITKVEDAVTKESQTDSYVFSIKIKDHSTSVFRYQCVLQENQLWKLRNLFIAAGKTVPKKKTRIDPNQIVGKLIGVTIEDAEDYKDKQQSQVAGVFPAAELGDETAVASADDDDEPIDDTEDDAVADDGDDLNEAPEEAAEEEEEAEEPEEEAEEDEAEEADPYEGLDRAELKRRIKAAQPDFKVLTRHTDDDLKAALAKIDAPAATVAAPAAKAAPAKRAPKPDTSNISDDDLDDLNIDDL